MVHGVFVGMTDYSNQNIEQILKDVELVQKRVIKLLNDEEKIINDIHEIRKMSPYNKKPMDLFDYIQDLNPFLDFISNIVLRSNSEVILAIKEKRISKETIQKIRLMDKRAWDFNKRLQDSSPAKFFTYDNDYDKELDKLCQPIEDIITDIMDYGGIADRLEEEHLTTPNKGNSIKDSVIEACDDLLSHSKILKDSPSENDFNTYLKSILDKMENIYAMDQTLKGQSSNGKAMGEVDIYIKGANNRTSIIEALKLDSLDRKYIEEHVERIGKYDKVGNEENFIIVYYTGKNFSEFSQRYENYISNLNINSIPCKTTKSGLSTSNRKVYQVNFTNNFELQTITHIVLNLG